MNDIITDITSLGPQGLFVVGMYLLGLAIKKSPISDWMIPYVIGLIGAVVAPFMFSTGDVKYNVPHPHFYLAIQGAVLAGVAVYAEQLKKQFLNRDKTNDGGTQFIVKSETVQPVVVAKPEETKPTENK